MQKTKAKKGKIFEVQLELAGKKPGDIDREKFNGIVNAITDEIKSGTDESKAKAKSFVLKGIGSENDLLRGVCVDVIKDLHNDKKNLEKDAVEFIGEAYSKLNDKFWDTSNYLARLEIERRNLAAYIGKSTKDTKA